ncbi:MAG: 1-deoxy-D-xylulose-5-phosphate reductoisomerase [Acidimicrobiia bacterium]|nr:1-deoxy-D-xylulose-5-phosphate reductoisomerase [Acidimicrobiia bacterium]
MPADPLASGPHRPRRIVVLGSTGSVGTQALELIRELPDLFEVVALACGHDSEQLASQAREFGVPGDAAIVCGDRPDTLAELARHPDADVVLNAVVGFAGLPATLAALETGTRLALANKESLIAGGPVVGRVRERSGAELVPVDSEHSALYQALRSGTTGEVRRLILTASGGPFRGRSRRELQGVTVEDALDHPTWDMGAKITIDSSTLMNKGLEVIEAHELFGFDYDHIDVVVHPQSIIHGMVEFTDGATIAQMSEPDMRLPIGLALGAPERHPVPYGAIDWTGMGDLTFEEPDREAFGCLALCEAAGRAGGGAPAAVSAANEVAVAAFLDRALPWTGIEEVVDEALQAGPGNVETPEDVLDVDRTARERARQSVRRRSAA